MPRKTLETLVKETKWVYKHYENLQVKWKDPLKPSSSRPRSKTIKRPVMPNGKPATDKQWVDIASEIQKRLQEEANEAALKNETLIDNPNMTVSELVLSWSEKRVDSLAKNLRPKTRAGYHKLTRVIARDAIFKTMPVRELQANDVLEYYDRLGERDDNEAKTIRNKHIVLKQVLNYGVMTNVVKQNVMGTGKESIVHPPLISKRKRKVPIEPAALAQLRKEAKNNVDKYGNWFEAYVWTLTYTGMYPSETLGLTWDNVYLDVLHPYIAVRRSQAYIPEQGGVIDEDAVKRPLREREIPLAQDYTHMIKEYRDYQKENARYVWSDSHLEATKVFCGTFGQPIKNDRAGRYLRKLAVKMNRPDINALNLRHAFACCLVRQGLLAPDVKQIMGHKNITTTLDIYADVLPDVSTQAAVLINDYMNGKTYDISTKVCQDVCQDDEEFIDKTANS